MGILPPLRSGDFYLNGEPLATPLPRPLLWSVGEHRGRVDLEGA